MPIQPQILDDLAAAGCHIVIDAATADSQRIRAVVNLWGRGTGNVTTRNADRIPPNETRGDRPDTQEPTHR